jgi:hypothetical protein
MASGVATSVGDVPVAIYQFGGRVLVKLTPLTGKVARLEFVIVPVIDNIDTKKKLAKFTNVKLAWKRFHAIHLIRCISRPIKYRLIIFASIRLPYDRTLFCKGLPLPQMAME